MAIRHAAVKVLGERGYASEWNADHVIDDASKPKNNTTLIVAASDSLDTTRADYVCDGIDDQDEINAAMAALPAHGGAVSLLDGTYQISNKIVFPDSNISIIGLGSNTVIQTTENVRMVEAANKEGLLISSLKITGAGAINIVNTIIHLTTVSKSRITDVWIEEAGNIGIYMSGCEFIEITDSFLSDSTFFGLWMANCNYCVFDNIIADSTVAGAVGVQADNCQYCKWTTCLAESNLYGFNLSGNSDHNLISGCTSINNTDTGIYIAATCDRNNVVDNFAVGNGVAQITDNGANNNLDNNQTA